MYFRDAATAIALPFGITCALIERQCAPLYWTVSGQGMVPKPAVLDVLYSAEVCDV
jgi:hypothetical protein